MGNSHWMPNGNTLTLDLAIAFTSGFTGDKTTYALMNDKGAQSTGYGQIGTWTVGTDPPDFTITATPITGPITPGLLAQYTVTVTPVHGFSGQVNLTATNLPGGVSSSPADVTLAGSPAQTIMTLVTTSGTQAVTSAFTITGTSGTLSHNATPSPSLVVQDFSIGVSPGSANTLPGGSAGSTVTVSPINGFNGSVSLAATGVPTNASPNFSQSILTGGGGTSTLNITTNTNIAFGTSAVTITASSGGLSRAVQVSFVVQDFTIGVSPGSASAVQGAAATYTVSISPQNGFNGTLSLSATGLPGSAQANFSPLVNNLSTLTVSTGALTPTGSYTLGIAATSMGRTRSTSVALTVQPQPITVTVSPVSPIPPGTYLGISRSTPTPFAATVTGTTNTAVTWQLLNCQTPAWCGSFSSEGSIPQTGPNTALYTPPGTIYYNSYVAIQATSMADGTTKSAPVVFQLLIQCGCVTLTHDSSYPNDPQGALTAGQQIHLVATVAGNYSKAVQWSTPSGPQGTISQTGTNSSGYPTAIYTAPSYIPGPGSVTLLATSTDSGTNGSSGSYTISLGQSGSHPQSDFNLSVTPPSASVSPTGSVSYTVNAAGVGGSSGTVALSVSGLPSSAAASFNPTTINVGGTSTLAITTTNTTISNYTFTITGQSPDGQYTHTQNATLQVQPLQQDFFLSISPASQSLGSTSIAGYAVRVIPINGFTGSVSFSVTGLPAGATANFLPPQVTSPGTTILTLTLPPNRQLGKSSFTVTGTSGGLPRSAPASLTVNSVPPGIPANIISPASGSTLTGTAASFKWDCGVRVSQYSLSVGSSPGAGDYYSTSACTNQTVNVNFPAGQSKVYATALSLIDGVWQSRSYSYSTGPALPTTGVSLGMRSSFPTAPVPPYIVLNNNQPSQIYPYCILTPVYLNQVLIGGICDGQQDARQVSTCKASLATVTVSLPDNSKPSIYQPDNQATFDVVLTADFSTIPGSVDLTCTYSGVEKTFAGAFQVKDAPPVILQLTQDELDAGGQPAFLSIYGQSFGKSAGNITICRDSNCQFTVPSSEIFVGTPTFWGPTGLGYDQINVPLTAAPAASTSYYVKVTNTTGVGGMTYQFAPTDPPTANQSNVRGFITVTPPPTLQIYSEGSLLAEGQCAHVTTDPRMPNLQFALVPTTSSPLLYAVNWALTITYPRVNGNADEIGLIARGLPANAAWAPTAYPYILGTANNSSSGIADIAWTYAALPQMFARFCIDGINPDISLAKSYLLSDNSYWSLPKLIAQESSWQHFINGHPNATSDGGYGLMQLTIPAPTAEQIWNWKANVDAGVSQFTTNQTNANAVWQSYVGSYNTYNSNHPTSPALPPNQDPEGGYCIFSFTPDGSTTHSFADAIALKRYNSNTSITGEYIEWDDPSHSFILYPESGNGKHYVQLVCSHPD